VKLSLSDLKLFDPGIAEAVKQARGESPDVIQQVSVEELSSLQPSGDAQRRRINVLLGKMTAKPSSNSDALPAIIKTQSPTQTRITELASRMRAALAVESPQSPVKGLDYAQGTSGSVLLDPKNGQNINAVAVLSDGRVITGSDDYTARIWNPQGALTVVLGGHTSPVLSIATLPGGHIVTGSSDRTAKVWDQQGKCLATLSDHADAVRRVAVSADGKILTASRDGLVKIWKEDGTCLETLPGFGQVQAVATLPHGNIVLGMDNGNVKIIDEERNCVADLVGHTEYITTSSFSRTAIS